MSPYRPAEPRPEPRRSWRCRIGWHAWCRLDRWMHGELYECARCLARRLEWTL